MHQRSVRIILILLLPEGKTGVTWEPSKEQFCFGNREELGRNVYSLFVVLNGLKFRQDLSGSEQPGSSVSTVTPL